MIWLTTALKQNQLKKKIIGTTRRPEKNQIRSILEQYYAQSILGDVNGDLVINVQDIVLAVNLVLAGEYSSAADLNSDNLTNVLDVVQIINIILS